MEKYNKKQEELREKEKQRAAEMQYAQMQQYPMRNEMPGMFPAQMGYAAYPMDPNTYPHMRVMGGGYGPFYMPPPNDDQERNGYPLQGNYMPQHPRYPTAPEFYQHNMPPNHEYYAQQKQPKKSSPQNVNELPQQAYKEYPQQSSSYQQSFKEHAHNQQTNKEDYPQQSYKEDNNPHRISNLSKNMLIINKLIKKIILNSLTRKIIIPNNLMWKITILNSLIRKRITNRVMVM